MNKFVKNVILGFNNFLLKFHKKKVKPSDMLILLPRCMQFSDCRENVVDDLFNCKKCGRCQVGEVVDISRKYNIPAYVATGSMQAKECVKKHRPKLILAVACERELFQGVVTVFPIPVYAVCNERPNGPCRNTKFNKSDLEEAINRFSV